MAGGMPSLSEMPMVVSDYVNSGISINYVHEWGLKQALRELVQNSVDGMTSFLNENNGHKSDWKVNIIENTYNGTKYRSFEFTWPSQNIILGKITYHPKDNQLILENPGTIDKFNLLLGGSGSAKRQDKLSIY